jgi:hypothetical protein
MKFEVRRNDNVLFHGEIQGGRVQMSGPGEFAAAGTVEANGRIQLWAGRTLFATGHMGDRGRIDFLDLKGTAYHGQTSD